MYSKKNEGKRHTCDGFTMTAVERLVDLIEEVEGGRVALLNSKDER